MASVELYLGKAEAIPGVCLCCGEATREHYPTRLISLLGKAVSLQTPLCNLHKSYFRFRSLLFWAGMMVSILPLAIALALLLSASNKNALQNDRFLLSALNLAALWFLGWAMALVYLRVASVRLSGIRSGKIILVNVAPEYAEALRVLRQERMKIQSMGSCLNELPSIEALAEQASPLEDDARRALELADNIARAFNHDYVGTDHLLLGLGRVEVSGAGQVLKNCQLPVKLAEIEVQNITAPATASPSHLPVTPQLRKVMQNAWEEARARGHSRLGTAHILLGLVRQEEGIGTQILETFGLDLEDVRKQALRYLLDTDIAFFSANELGPRTPSDQAITEKLP